MDHLVSQVMTMMMSNGNPTDFFYDTTSSELRDAALAPTTLRSYNKNVNKFLTFTRLSSIKKLLLHTPTVIDQRLSQYIDYLFAHKGSFEYATQTLFGLIHKAPQLRFALGESRLRLRGWKNLKLSKSHPPITWELTCLFAVTMAKWGYHAEAVATLLSFDCYLRVSELTRIEYHDVLMPNDPRIGSVHTRMAVRLAKAKTGLEQSVSIDRADVQQVLHAYLLAYPFLERDRIFPFSPATFRFIIRQVAESLGLGEIPYVPHSFRHGGATHSFQAGATIEQIMFRGRWVAMESCRRYIQTARARLIRETIPSWLHETGSVFAPHMPFLLGHLMSSIPKITRRR